MNIKNRGFEDQYKDQEYINSLRNRINKDGSFTFPELQGKTKKELISILDENSKYLKNYRIHILKREVNSAIFKVFNDNSKKNEQNYKQDIAADKQESESINSTDGIAFNSKVQLGILKGVTAEQPQQKLVRKNDDNIIKLHTIPIR